MPGTVKSFSHDKSRAAEQLLQHYQAILRFLECHCALMNSVLAEHLLDQTTLEQLLDLREARASTDADTRACQLWCASVSCSPTCQSTRKLDSRWKQVCPWNRGGHALKLRQGLSCQGTWCRRNKIAAQRWSEVIGHAWSFTYLQIAKTFILHRIDLKSFNELPGTDSRGAASSMLTASNVYSLSESILLSWLEIHMKKIMPQAARRLTQFDTSLSDGVALCCVMLSHWPPLSRFMGQLVPSPVSESEVEGNMKILLRMMDAVQCPFAVKEEQLLNPTAVDMLFFVAYLYTWIPQLIPKSTVEFAGKLQEEQVRDVELTNPGKKVISYAARLQGHADFHLEQQSIRIEPGGTAVCRVTCTPTTGVTQTSNLVLASKRDGGAFAATLVFQLVSKVLPHTETSHRRQRNWQAVLRRAHSAMNTMLCAGEHQCATEANHGGEVAVRVEAV